MTASNVQTEMTRVAGALREMGADSAVLTSAEVAHLVATGRDLLSLREIPGVGIRAKAGPDELSVRLNIEQEKKITKAIHLCIGVLERTGRKKSKLR